MRDHDALRGAGRTGRVDHVRRDVGGDVDVECVGRHLGAPVGDVVGIQLEPAEVDCRSDLAHGQAEGGTRVREHETDAVDGQLHVDRHERRAGLRDRPHRDQRLDGPIEGQGHHGFRSGALGDENTGQHVGAFVEFAVGELARLVHGGNTVRRRDDTGREDLRQRPDPDRFRARRVECPSGLVGIEIRQVADGAARVVEQLRQHAVPALGGAGGGGRVEQIGGVGEHAGQAPSSSRSVNSRSNLAMPKSGTIGSTRSPGSSRSLGCASSTDSATWNSGALFCDRTGSTASTTCSNGTWTWAKASRSTSRTVATMSSKPAAGSTGVRSTRVLTNMPMRLSRRRSPRPATGVPTDTSSVAPRRASSTTSAACSTMTAHAVGLRVGVEASDGVGIDGERHRRAPERRARGSRPVGGQFEQRRCAGECRGPVVEFARGGLGGGRPVRRAARASTARSRRTAAAAAPRAVPHLWRARSRRARGRWRGPGWTSRRWRCGARPSRRRGCRRRTRAASARAAVRR